MYTKITSFILLFFCLTVHSSAQFVKNFMGSKIMGGPEDDAIDRAWKLPNNDYLIFGFTQSDFLEDSTATFYVDEQSSNGASFLYCLSPSGTIKWKKIIGGTNFDQIIDIVTKPNEIICFGVTESDNLDLEVNKGSFDCWVLKLDYNGNKLLSKSFGGSGVDILWSIHEMNDSTYLAYIDVTEIDGDFAKSGFVAGKNLVRFDDSFSNMQHVRFLGASESLNGQASKFNKNGNLITSAIVRGNGTLITEMYKPNGDLIYNHSEYSDTSNTDVYQENYTGSVFFIGDTVVLPISKGYFPSGSSFDKGKLEIVKLAPDGKVVKRFTSTLLTAVSADYIGIKNERIFVTGYYLNYTDSSWSLPNDNVKGFMLSLDKDLNLINTLSLDGNEKQYNSTFLTYADFDFNSLEYTLFGSSSSFEVFNDAQPKGNADVFFAKYKAYPLGIKSVTNSNNDISVFPNPFNDYLQLSVNNNEVKRVELIDLLGRVIQTDFSNKIETSNIGIGQYVLKLHLKNDEVYQYKVIKD